MKYYGPNIGHSLRDPLHTITTKDRFALIETLLATSPNLTEEQRYRAWWVARLLDTADSSDPAGDTCIATDRCRFVKVGDDVIVDVLMRMLQPRELYNAMGFPTDYQIDVDSEGKPIPKSVQIGRCGNAVPPILAKVVIRSNLEEFCEETIAA